MGFSVVRLMTSAAFELGRFKGGAKMTIFAGYRGMRAQQREARQPVIEDHFIVPTRFVVTFIAFLALLIEMRIVFAVTAYTCLFQFGIHIAAMTYIARHIAMFTLERIFSLGGVIEHRARPRFRHVTRFAFFAE